MSKKLVFVKNCKQTGGNMKFTISYSQKTLKNKVICYNYYFMINNRRVSQKIYEEWLTLCKLHNKKHSQSIITYQNNRTKITFYYN